ncbi:uncharacterized protein LOC655346 [Tribolium castaneum]|uniref:MADF domain-containing protein n=1 Tax=Tribolium castaneum TaxID=7070 RepID=D6WE98_TRICA|nr:PREDICTED: uncharacterized protein LOC655346 [Tribolium castaneum]EEZ99902.1 hypothetical protein TcasGA2_TC002686 [Tribolium castaneum]|eukprot:XP_966980.1 PREDICTED: uncharacterized protein LOC655346 [Tribolium castaneum]
MTDLRQYTKVFLKEFIDLYKSHPSLWQIKNKDYRDRTKKAAAYEVLINKCREVEPECDKDTVVKKINSLRTCYRKEFKKVQRSVKAGGEYKPKLWYFDLLSFLNEDSLLSGNDSYFYLDEDATNDFFGGHDPLTSQSESLSESGPSSPAMFSKNKRKRDEPAEASFMQRLEEDEFDLLGKIYASKLRKLEKAQRIYAEKIINDALFEAELGNLNRQWRLVTGDSNFRSHTNTEIDLKSEYPDSDPADTSFVD